MPFDLMIVLPPTDTNPKNLELAPPQSVTATRLDQLVYSPNYYIQIFRLNLLPAVRIEPSTARSKLSPTRLPIALWEMKTDLGSDHLPILISLQMDVTITLIQHHTSIIPDQTSSPRGMNWRH